MLFSFEGRAGRIWYWMSLFGVLIIFAEPHPIFMVLIMWSVFAIQVKRWHDLDQSGWWVLINFVPILNLWAIIANGFFKGTEGTNRFDYPHLFYLTPAQKQTMNKRVLWGTALLVVVWVMMPYLGLDEESNPSLSDLQRLAKQGDAVAQYNLGMLYDAGQGVPQDYEQARDWFLKAAAQGDAVAQKQLGILDTMDQ